MSFPERRAALHPEMAETISEHHIPAMNLAHSPSLDMDATQDSAEGYRPGDTEFPFAREMLAGAKCCSKCGATKTPQWREGPFGPKTLCNACGVKRTRQLRAETDGGAAKRRKITASPAAKPGAAYAHAKPHASKPHYPSDAHLESYPSLDYDDAYPDTYHYHQPAPRRPTRRAAEEAAVKTARYARTGEFPGGVALATSTSSSGHSLPSSDCPEEVSWTPLAAEAAARGGLPGMPLDCYAAVNLMTMSAADPSGSPVQAAALQRPAAAAAAGGHPSPMASGAFEASLARADGPPRGERLTAADLLDLYKSLPPAKVAELVRLNEDLDSAVREAQGAGLAVAAVAAVLAAKQAAALRARELVAAASKRLRRFTAEMDTQFGPPPKALPRFRTSLKKAASA